jgi:hypothetical protein
MQHNGQEGKGWENVTLAGGLGMDGAARRSASWRNNYFESFEEAKKRQLKAALPRVTAFITGSNSGSEIQIIFILFCRARPTLGCLHCLG